MKDDHTKTLNVDEVADLLRISRGTVYKLARSGELPSFKVGRKLRFSSREIVAYLNAKAAAQSDNMSVCEYRKPDQNAGASLESGQDMSGAKLDALEAFPMKEGSQYILAGTGLPGDLLTSILALDGTLVTRNQTSSYSALVNLYAGMADAAFTHLYDQRSNSYNVPFVKHLCPGMPVVVIRLVSIDQGFVVAEGNPKKISSWGALLRPDITLANRELGSGSRILLDEKLISMEARPESIAGYDNVCNNGREAASEIIAGYADVTVGTPTDAGIAGAEFIPMQKGWLDIAIAKSEHTEPLVRSVRNITASEHMRHQLDALGRDTSHLGAIIYEC